jgi:simple sugar transport system permease protein
MGFITVSRLRELKLQLSIFGVLIAVFLLFLIGNPMVFTGPDIYYSFMSTIPLFGIMALAMTFVVTLGEIDLSFPSILGFSAWVFGTVLKTTQNLPLAILCSLLVGLFGGACNAFLIVKIKIPSLVATIGTMFLWRGAVNVAAKGKGISLVAAQESFLYDVIVGRIGNYLPMQFVWMVVAGIVLGLYYKHHRFGGHVLFVGDNEESARMMGIDVNRVKAIVFMQMGLFAAIGGIMATLEVTYFWPSQGEGFLLTTLAAVFIGGTSVFGGQGTMFGTFIGALIIGSLEAGIVAIGLSGFWVKFIFGLIIIISVSIYATILKKTE